MKVELVYDKECPNIQGTRNQLSQAFQSLKLKSNWIEWERSSPNCPHYARDFGSPTILINQKDILNEKPSGHNCCRIYNLANHHRIGIPDAQVIINAMQKALNNANSRGEP